MSLGVPGITLDIGWELEFEVGIFGGHYIARIFQGREKNGGVSGRSFSTVKFSIEAISEKQGLVYWSWYCWCFRNPA